LKDHTLWLLEHNYVPSDVSDIFGVSECTSLQQWKKNQADYGIVIPPPITARGWHHIPSADITHDLFALLEECPELFLDEIQEWLIIACNTSVTPKSGFGYVT
jgi:hypothetical protein